MILIVDDDNSIRASLKLVLSRTGYDCMAVASPDEALAAVRQSSPSLIIMDMNYSGAITGQEGLELLRKVKILAPTAPVILMTAWGSIPLAVEGMRAGAFDFITKPWDNRHLLRMIETASQLSGGNAAGTAVNDTFDRGGIIGETPAIKEVLAICARIAATDASVLILGENGTGKEMVAEAIHLNSRRKEKPFVKVNLGGISASLFESEMFGHRRGAFTGAVADRVGRFELADKGTIFLDEIGDLDPSCQVKLLRVLQEHTFEPLGDSRPHKTDVRVISATNADLRSMITDRRFREDLFYRINLITLTIPPLRDRRDDIPLLAAHFASASAATTGIPAPKFTSNAMELLQSQPYPGNIRELKNLIERVTIICQKPIIDYPDLQPLLPTKQSVEENGSALDRIEQETIAEAINRFDGNLTKAASHLGITRQTLYRRMDKYKLR